MSKKELNKQISQSEEKYINSIHSNLDKNDEEISKNSNQLEKIKKSSQSKKIIWSVGITQPMNGTEAIILNEKIIKSNKVNKYDPYFEKIEV